jgi:hypothetical protein
MTSNLSPHQFDTVNPLAAKHALPDWDQFAYGDDHAPRDVEVSRLESRQQHLSASIMSGLDGGSDSGPIEVVHHVDHDRYEVWDGNHRAAHALRSGRSTISAIVHTSRGKQG